jgi:hypothetical protein
MFPVYQRASAGASWGDAPTFRKCLDEVWGWLLDKSRGLTDTAARSEALVDALSDVDDDLAFAAANSLYGLTAQIVESDSENAFLAAQCNLDTIDSFLQERLRLDASTDADRVVDSHVLIQLEMARQNADVALCQSAAYPEDAAQQMRAHSVGISILDKMWRE